MFKGMGWIYKQYIIAIAVAIACFMPPFIGLATNIALPEIMRDLKLPDNMWGLIHTSYLLISTILLIPAARYADKTSKKQVFLIGVLFIGFGSLGIYFVNNWELFMVMRAIEGIGNALMFGTAIALVTTAVKTSIRGTAIGIVMTGVFIGQLIGPLLGFLGECESYGGWRIIYLTIVPFALISFILTIAFIPKDTQTDNKSYDCIGSVLFMVGMLCSLYGLSKIPDIMATVLLCIGIIIMLIFFKYEIKNPNPIIPVYLIVNNKQFTMNNIANLLYYLAIFSMGPLISMYLANIGGLSPLQRSLIITTEGLILVFFTIMIGKLHDHLLPKRVYTSGLLLIGIGTFITIFGLDWSIVNTPTELIKAVISTSIVAFGIGLIIIAIINKIFQI